MGNMREAFYSLLFDLMESNDKVVLLLADIGMYVFRHIKKEFPDRYFNFGISEAAMVGAAAGMAMQGYYPVMFTWTPFITERVLEQVKVNLAARGLPAIIVSVAGSYDQGYLGLTHQCPADVGIFYNVPEMKIAAPASTQEFKNMLTLAVQNPSLYYLRMTVRESDTNFYCGNIGQAFSLWQLEQNDLDNVLVIACGDVTKRVALALQTSLSAKLLYYPWVRPFDEELLSKSVGNLDKVLVVEPWYETLTMPVTATLAKLGVKAIIKSVAVPRRFIKTIGWPEEIDKEVGLDIEGIQDAFYSLQNDS